MGGRGWRMWKGKVGGGGGGRGEDVEGCWREDGGG